MAITGAGSATVWVTDDLEVSLAGVGSVEYYGCPAGHRNASGLGRVRLLGDRQPGSNLD
jgi:hypothetical protein